MSAKISLCKFSILTFLGVSHFDNELNLWWEQIICQNQLSDFLLPLSVINLLVFVPDSLMQGHTFKAVVSFIQPVFPRELQVRHDWSIKGAFPQKNKELHDQSFTRRHKTAVEDSFRCKSTHKQHTNQQMCCVALWRYRVTTAPVINWFRLFWILWLPLPNHCLRQRSVCSDTELNYSHCSKDKKGSWELFGNETTYFPFLCLSVA